MKRDLVINFSKLDDILNKVNSYSKAIANLRKALDTVDNELSALDGNAVDALSKAKQKIEKDIDKYEEQCNALQSVLSGYITDMNKYISPVSRETDIQVDRNDIWFNLRQIDEHINRFNSHSSPYRQANNPKDTAASYYNSNLSKEEKAANDEKAKRNKVKIESALEEMDSLKTYLKQEYNGLDKIYTDKVKKYENTDDEYAKDAKRKIYHKYANVFEQGKDIIDSARDIGKNFVDGAISSAEDLADFVVGVGKYGASAFLNIPGLPTPEWAKTEFNKTNEVIGAVVNDPYLIVEGYGQDLFDNVDRKGIAYGVGKVGTDILIAVVIKKGPSKIKTKFIKKSKVKNVVSNKFKNQKLFDEHYTKHSGSLKKVFDKSSYSISDYLKDANHVINNGTYVKELNGYVKLIGGKGSAKYAFVGLDRATGKITTFHIKTVSELIKKAPSLGLKK